jgi:hypothetical protein
VNAIETNVSTLSLSAGAGGAFVTETNAVTVDTLTVAVNRVGSDASVPATASGTASVTQEDLSSAGKLVLISSAGDITINAGTAASDGVQTAGNLLLQASAGAITLSANLTNSTGHTSLNANGNIVQNANITAGAAGATVELIAGGAISMGAGATIGTNNGNILMNAAGGDVALETLNAGTGNVAITASGNILDAHATAVEDITAAGLILKAGNGIGYDVSVNAIETNVSTLSLSAGAGGAFVTETNAVTVDTLTVAVNRVGSDASVPATASGTASVTQEDLSTSGAGNLWLSTGGTLTLNPGTAATSGVSTASGNITLVSTGTATDIIVNANIVSSSGTVNLTAARDVSMANGVGLNTNAAVNVKATAGDVFMPNASISAGAGNVSVNGLNTVTPGVVITTGSAVIDTGPSGQVVFSQPSGSGAANQGINVVSNSVSIITPLSSAGGSLLVAPLNSSSPVAIVVGGTDPGGVLHLGINEVNLLQNGFADITLGNAQANQSIVLNGGTTATPLHFLDPLVINAGGAANTVALSGVLTGDSFTVQGSLANTSTTLTAADISMAGDIVLSGVVQVGSGATVITAGNNATDAVTGSLTVSGNIVGLGGANETLEIRSENNVQVTGSVAGIDALTVTAVNNVTFNEAIAVSGNLVVNAGGVVKFDKSLTLTAGGTLTVQGASSVEFGNGATVQVDGDLTINAETLSLMGGANSLSSTVPNSTLTITSAASNNQIALGLNVVGSLSLSPREIEAIGANFSKVVIGKAGLGAITLAGNTDLTSITGAALEVQGSTITIASGGAGAAVQTPGALTLTASGNVDINSGISTAGVNSVSVVSIGGNINMAAGTLLNSRGGDVQIRATNAQTVAIAGINARSADLSVSGVVNIQAGSATVTDANQDATADIFAKAVNFSGYGPSSTTNGNVLEVVAGVVRIDAPQGSVVRHSDLTGRTYFDVIHAGHLYQELVVIGDVTRVTENPSSLLTKGDTALIAAGVPSNSTLLQNPVAIQSLASAIAPIQTTASSSSAMAVSRYLATTPVNEALNSTIDLSGLGLTGNQQDLLSSNTYGLTNGLQHAYVLGTPGEQPLVSGLNTFSQDTFEYWVDTLSL